MASPFGTPTKKRILIYPCGTEIGLEIWRSLHQAKDIQVLGANSCDDYSRHLYPEQSFFFVPFVDSPETPGELARLVAEQRIDAVFPSHDDAVMIAAAVLGERAITSPLMTCSIARSKRATLDHLQGVVDLPHYYRNGPGPHDLAMTTYPLFLRPEKGQGTRGCYRKVDDYEELSFYRMRNDNLVVTEYLPGDEYTVDCFTDFHGRLRFSSPRVRARVSHGIAIETHPEHEPDLSRMAEQLNAYLPFNGVWFFQAKRSGSRIPCLTEFACRPAGSSGLCRAMGVNLPLLAVYNHFKQEVDIVRTYDTACFCRALANYAEIGPWKNLYVDLDDTLFNGVQLNADLLRLIVEAHNAGKSVHILTRRHSYPRAGVFAFLSTLAEFHIVCDDAVKADFIEPRESIFIDDSFAERVAVFRKLGIPCFGPEAVECLRGDE